MKCDFECERPLFLGDLDPGCQFEEEAKFIEREGKQYCQYHLPMKDKTGYPSPKARWDKKRIEEFNGLIFKHIEEAKEKEQTADLTGVVFPGNIDFSQFSKDNPLPNILFIRNQFSSDASFHEVAFIGIADFNTASFNGETNFSEAVFSALTIFSEAAFGGSVCFSKAAFSGNVFFFNSTFDFADFSEAAFSGTANFSEAAFGDYTDFSEAAFGSYADFDCSSKDEAAPSNSFHSADFKYAKFKKGVIFRNRRFLDTTVFKGVHFQEPPESHNSKLHQDTDFTDAKFPDTSSEHAARAYRTLKLAMGDVRARNEEAFFYALEQESLRKLKSTPWPVKFAAGLYKFTSDYGRSFVRPLVLLVVVFVFFAAEYSILADAHTPPGLGESTLFSIDQMVRPFKALSIGYDDGEAPKLVLRLFKEYPVWVRLLSFVQTVFSLGLLTLFILAVRRRFKLS